MKKQYKAPKIKMSLIDSSTDFLTVSDGNGVYTDDPQKPGNALSRRHKSWIEDEEDWEEN